MVKIVSQNVRGLRQEFKRKALLLHLRAKGEVVCMQETHFDLEMDSQIKLEWGSKNCFYSHGTSASRGVAILIDRKSEIKILGSFNDENGRIVGINYEEGGKKFILVNIYAPNNDDPSFFLKVFKLLEEYEGKRIITGDFNLVLNSEIDRTMGSSSNYENAAEVIRNYMEDTMMCDIWRVRNENEKVFTFMRKGRGSRKYIGSRIDMVILDIGIASWVKQVRIFPKFKSDHAGMIIEILPNESPRGRGYWKLNSRVLYEVDYLKRINQAIDEIIQNTANKYENPQELWEAVKISVIAHSQEYCRERAINRKLILHQLEEAIMKLSKDTEKRTELELNILERTHSDLEIMKEEDVQGAIFRTKARWYNLGESASSKYFFALEKYKNSARGMNSVLIEPGHELTDPTKILNELRKFYEKLYKSEGTESFDYKNLDKLTLSNELKNNTNGLFTMEELEAAIKGMKKGVSPGIDGLTTEFYIMFHGKLKDVLLNAINFAFQTEKLHKSALRGVITLIPKKNLDTRIISHLRPISLLSTDYKLVEKMLANRIKPALDHIIHQDQKGFMSNRRISCNIRRILDLIDYADQQNQELPGIIVSIDFMKCFDRIELSSLLSSLKYFDFGEDFIKWTKIIYTDAQSCIINNGHLSKNFPVNRGVKQGGPCSAYYFLCIAEVLAIEIRKDPKIKGIFVKEIEKILGQYADDIDLYLFGEGNNLQNALNVINTFCKRTGFKINYNKTTVYRIGSLRKSKAKLYSIHELKWVDEKINILGVEVCKDKKKLDVYNYETMFDKIKSILLAWGNRGLSLYGKILIINTLIASLFVYKMSVLPKIQETTVVKIEKIMNEFLWNNRKPKIKLSTLQKNKRDGGAGLVNLRIKDDSLKIAWISIIQTDIMIEKFAYLSLNSTMCNDIWRCNVIEKDIVVTFRDTFWRDVLIAWSKYNSHTPANRSEIVNQIIWYNSHIKCDKKVLFIKGSYEAGLITISQLILPNGQFMPINIICAMFSLSVMECNSILSAIPKHWKKMMLEEETQKSYEYEYDKILKVKKTARYYYKHVNSTNVVKVNLAKEWNRKVNSLALEEEDVQKIIIGIDRVTNQSKLRSFQLRLMHRAIVFKDKLFRWKITENNLCCACKKEKESMEHYFWFCPEAQKFWSQVDKLIKDKVQDVYTYDIFSILFNQIHEKDNHIANFIVLVTKQYMYASKCQKKEYKIQELKYKIESTQRYEKYHAISTNKVEKHCRKWNVKNYNGTGLEKEYINQYVCNMSEY